MVPPKSHILTINGGSSSIKFALFDASAALSRSLTGKIDRIGSPHAVFQAGDEPPQETGALTYAAAVESLMAWFQTREERHGLAAVGHRIVHGGPRYGEAGAITPEMLEELRRLRPFAPRHLPEEILLIEAFQRRFPTVLQVACFDTAFHHGMPRRAQIMPVARRYQEMGVRRYGFHGLSYAFLMEELARIAGPEAARGRIILAHMGNGVSLAAVRDGKSIDTSMGFTPASGVPMGTRSGDLDPGLIWWLADAEGLDARRFNELVNFQSGLLGVSETSSDMRDLLEREKDDVRAAEAVELFCYQFRKWIGAFAAALGGLDALVFAGGIGENAPVIRARICDGLGFLGVAVDGGPNMASEGVISPPGAPVTVRVMRSDEELMIARETRKMLAAAPDAKSN